MQKLEDQVFSTDIGEEDEDIAAFDTIHSNKANKKNDIDEDNNRKANNIRRNEAHDKIRTLTDLLYYYCLVVLWLFILVLSGFVPQRRSKKRI